MKKAQKTMRVFIIGASGLVGSNCLHYMRRDPEFEVLGTHFSFETNETVYFNVFKPWAGTYDLNAFRPDVIIHTGALTHVDYCETHPEESYRHTVGSTEAVLRLSEKYEAPIVYISSDYVFDGKNGPYSEEDPVNPLSVYGQHKLQAENLLRSSALSHLILRITNVYGEEIRGKNFVAFLCREAQSGKKTKLKLPSDQYATPVNALDVGRIASLLIKDRKSGIYHVAPDEYLSRVELADKVLSYYPNNKIDIVALPTSELGQAAARPLKGGLKNDKIKREYPGFQFSTVDDYMRKKHGLS
jgi:dTDP-4-dehydrorhamnose reductase